MPHPRDPVRVGVVGLGGMGRTHARNVTELGHDVVAGADVIEQTREQFAVDFDATGYENHEAMLEAEDLDAMVVTTPNAYHAPAAVSALEAGVDVLVEKPLADSVANAERVVAAARESPAFCMVGFHNRFSTAASLFATQREEGRFGQIEHVEANYLRRRGIPTRGSWFTDRSLSGGGALIDIGVHAVDFALYLADFPEVREVSGVTRATFGNQADYADPDDWAGTLTTDEQTFDVEDSASAFLRCDGDTTISLEVAWATNREPTSDFFVRGTEAGARLGLGGGTVELFEASNQGLDHYADTELSGTLEPTGHRAEDRAFLEAVATDSEPAQNTVEEAMQVQRVLEAIYRSSETAESVRL